jgi:hypothetical protein
MIPTSLLRRVIFCLLILSLSLRSISQRQDAARPFLLLAVQRPPISPVTICRRILEATKKLAFAKTPGVV